MKEYDEGAIHAKESTVNLTEFLDKPHLLFEMGIPMARAL
jgi:hypothetical protein